MLSNYLTLIPLISSLAIASPIISPRGAGSRIQSISNPYSCVTVQGGTISNDGDVALSSCFSETDTFAAEQRWSVIGSSSQAEQQIDLILNTEWCLDGNNDSQGEWGIKPKISKCDYQNNQQQHWAVEPVNSNDGSNYFRFKVNGLCLDVEKDSGPGYSKPYPQSKALQLWECHDDDHPDAQQQYFTLI
ncbi:uncharacterized protein L201_000406 [Kwoniella dendrophila CBS 6074]|uniref:Ricin B lectin domain-containing protein n=1 Tax=Kwoniella dendrophila CBS 6074 TaxID=1295534 RepID=A0AAX4JL79_9TREE